MDGTITFDLSKKSEKRKAIGLSFNPRNKESASYNALYESLPAVNGLKLKTKKAEFVFDLMTELEKKGFKIVNQA